jgi:hypothetical protein
LRQEKYIAASDNGGIIERWKYGRRLLEDGEATTPAGNLRHGVLDRLITHATARGYKLSKSEINYRLQCARAYKTEAEISTACGDFATWSDLRAAGFPAVEVPDSGEPYDPRDADEKWRDFRDEQARREAENSQQGALFELPVHFSHDTFGPRTPLSTLIAACDESERYTANMQKRDEERRAYVDELTAAADGNVSMTWYEAEGRRLGLDGLGLASWDEFDEILRDFFSHEDPGYIEEPDEDE